MQPPKPTVAWTERKEIKKTNRHRDRTEKFTSRVRELTKQNAKMEEVLYEIHAISKMSSFVEAITEEKKKKSCIIL